jgi:hypothetical protein
MRAIILDTNKTGKVTFDLESIRKQMKDYNKIAILLERTTLEKIDQLDPNDIIGYVENISLHKGVYRGDVVIVQPDYKELVNAYIKIDQFHLALNVDGDKDVTTEVITINKINNIYYVYMEKSLN